MIPYWRLSSFYFFYFALLGAYVPYWSLYLQDAEYSALEIGWLTGAVMVTKIVAPNVWGWLADRYAQRLRVVQAGALLALILFCGIFFSDTFATLLAVVLAYSFFWNAILAQFEVITLAHLGRQYNRYSLIRVWGSIGFVVAVAALGMLFDWISVQYLPLIMASLLAAIWVCSLVIVDVPATPAESVTSPNLKAVLALSPVWAFFVVCALLQVAHGAYYTFFSVHLEDLGYSRSLIGMLWSLGVVAEVVLFLFMHLLLPRYGIRMLMLLSLVLAVVRWIIIGFAAEHLLLLLFAQLLHAATFGVFHAVSIELLRRLFPASLAGQGLAIYSGISFGAGGAIGAVISGWLWQYGAGTTYGVASLVSGVALVLAWLYVGKEERVEAAIHAKS